MMVTRPVSYKIFRAHSNLTIIHSHGIDLLHKQNKITFFSFESDHIIEI